MAKRRDERVVLRNQDGVELAVVEARGSSVEDLAKALAAYRYADVVVDDPGLPSLYAYDRTGGYVRTPRGAKS